MNREDTIEKLKKRVEEVKTRKMTVQCTVAEFQAWEDERTEEIHDRPPESEGKKIQAKDFWGSEDGYLWLAFREVVPKTREGEKAVGFFDFNSIHEGYASGFEAMLYINGKAYCGIDENHSHILLEAYAGQEANFLIKLWAGITGGPKYPIYHQIQPVALGILSPEIEEFALLAEMALKQAEIFPWKDSRKRILLSALEECFRMIYWIGEEEAFRVSVQEAYKNLQEKFKKYPERQQFTVNCVGHTHIDLAWMWRVKHTKEKALRSFSTALRLHEEFPEFRFFHSTPQLYQYVKEEYPSLYQDITKRIQEGCWEAGGGMWVEADCNLPGGESLVRQILYGKRFLKEEFGVDSRFLWLPDAFGFSWCIPQLMKLSGITAFFTSKLSWNKQNRFPHDTFRWRGMDGSEVLAYFLTTPAYGFPTQEWAVTYNGDISPRVLEGSYELYQEKEWNEDILLTYGHGDGGGGCTREMIQKIQAVEQVPFTPEVRFCKTGDFFEELEKRTKEMPLPVWDGELYLEYHRGTFTSQAFMKKENRRLEGRLRDLEYLLCCQNASERKNGEGQRSLETCWKLLLKNQFHDILPGSSIREVYKDARKDYQWLNRELDQIEEELFSKEPGITLWNTGNWNRTAYVEVPPLQKGMGYCLENGESLEWERSYHGSWLIRADKLPPLGGIYLEIKKTEEMSKPKRPCLSRISLEERKLETERYIVGWNEEGSLSRLYDRWLDFEVFGKEPGNRLVVYEDKPLLFDAWDIDFFYCEKSYCPILDRVEIVENTAFRTILRFFYYFQNSVLVQDLILYKERAEIVFDTKINWQERQCLLKAQFPVNVLAREAVFDVQFGNIKRSTLRNTSVEEAKFEVLHHRFVDMSQRNRGVAVLNDCKYGCSAKDGTIGLTLMKSPIDPDRTADLGEHSFTYSICPHQGSWQEGEIQRMAFERNCPVVVHSGRFQKELLPLIELDGDYIELDAVKRAEDGKGYILRFHEYGGGDASVTVTSPYGLKSFEECNLLEQRIGEENESECIKTTLKPYEIKTFRIFLNEEER